VSRTITTHIADEERNSIAIEVIDEPGPGNACHVYDINWGPKMSPEQGVTVNFQHGPLQEAGPNGLTNESLLAVVIDRLEGFQQGKYACEANAKALTSVKLALMNLKIRTTERISRGVEGSNEQ